VVTLPITEAEIAHGYGWRGEALYLEAGGANRLPPSGDSNPTSRSDRGLPQTRRALADVA
jgi:hypothetical protein